MSESRIGTAVRTVALGVVLALALEGCGSAGSSPKPDTSSAPKPPVNPSPNPCKKFNDEVQPGKAEVVETDTTSEGTYTYIILNGMGSVSVRQTLQPDGKNVDLNIPSLAQETVSTTLALTSTMQFHEPGHDETITVYAQDQPKRHPMQFQSNFCPTPQGS